MEVFGINKESSLFSFIQYVSCAIVDNCKKTEYSSYKNLVHEEGIDDSEDQYYRYHKKVLDRGWTLFKGRFNSCGDTPTESALYDMAHFIEIDTDKVLFHADEG